MSSVASMSSPKTFCGSSSSNSLGGSTLDYGISHGVRVSFVSITYLTNVTFELGRVLVVNTLIHGDSGLALVGLT